MRAAYDLRLELLEHQRDFYQTARNSASESTAKAYIFGSPSTISRTMELCRILHQHKIEFYRLKNALRSDGINFHPESSFVVPTNQAQYRLVQSIFEKRTQFDDSLFYDVSAWTLPLALNLDWGVIEGRAYSTDILGEKGIPAQVENTPLPVSGYAYIMEWTDYYAPKVLYDLLDKNLRVKVATSPISLDDDKEIGYGSILIPVKNQPIHSDSLHSLLAKHVQERYIQIHPMKTGFRGNGIDLGSPKLKPLVKPKIALLVGNGIRAYEAGEVWHLLDWRMDIDLTLLPIEKLSKVNLNDYNTLVLVDGEYGKRAAAQKQVRSWLETGGSVIAFKRAVKWLSDGQIIKTKFKEVEADTTLQRNYAYLDRYSGAQNIGGSIFSTRIDLSHPVNYGYQDQNLPVFLNSKKFLERPANAYSYPVVFDEEPLLSGYVSKENLEQVSNSPVVIVSKFGKGRVISFGINPNFRAFWYGTNRLFTNSLFFSRIIDSKSAH